MKKSFISSRSVAPRDNYNAKRPDLFCCPIGTALLCLCGQSLRGAIFNIANGDVTGLKNAITTANSNAQNDTIELAVNGTYTLTVRDNGVTGLPQIGPDGGRTLTINGNGATIQRSSAGGTLTFRIFYIQSGANATISGLTLTNGNVGTGSGGAIYNDRGTLMVTNCAITANGNSGGHGGAIYNDGESANATLTIANCTITGNFGDYGAAIYNDGEGVGATLTITNSTISGNVASQYGGGIWNDGAFGSATLNVANSTFSQNSASLDTGAIHHDAYTGSATGSITNCTFSQNSASTSGGGIYVSTGVDGGTAGLQLGNNIFKAGANGANIVNNTGTITSQGYNLSNDAAGGNGLPGPGGFLNQTGDQRNTDPLLDPAGLANNGGPTQTILLQPASPAIDKGRDVSGAGQDQRGSVRPVTYNGSIVPPAGGDRSDIGAVELAAPGGATPTPTSTPTPVPTATPTPTSTPSPTPTPTPTPPPTISISGTLFYCSNPVPSPVPNVTMTRTGTTSGSTLTDGSGNYSFIGLPSGGNYTVTPTKAARVPGTGNINTVDVIGVQKQFLTGTFLTGCKLAAADVNGDNNVNTQDVIAVQRFFSGFTTAIANVGEYKFTPASRTYTGITTNQTAQNYDTLVFGDVATPFSEVVDSPPQIGAR